MDRSVILITGANRGIGLETARQLAVQRHDVILTARSLAKAEQAAATLTGSVMPLSLDVVDDASVDAAVSVIRDRFGRLDALVNNAGIDYDTDQSVESADLDRVRRILETNVLGVWRVSQAFIPLLRESRHPRVVNVSSGSGQLSGWVDPAPGYAVSKTGLNALTVQMAADWKRDRILVNAVCPGWVATDMGGSGGGPVADGAQSVIWGLALPDDGPTGGFFRHGKRLDW